MLPFFRSTKDKNQANAVTPTASQSQILRQTVQSVFPEANPWRADFSKTFVCNNGKDNIPVESIMTKKKEKFTFIISQNRGAYKTLGQDCMAIAKHGNFEVITLSDGHDDEGHYVSQGVCGILPSILLRLIQNQTVEQSNSVKEEVGDELIFDAFDECEEVVCWMPGQATKRAYVRIAAGEYQGVAGYCTGFDEEQNAIVSVYEEFETEGGDEVEVGSLEIVVSPDDILIPRFNGGGTCVTLIRNVATNECRAAVAGDSRLLIYLPSTYTPEHIKDSCLVPTYGNKISTKTNRPFSAYISSQHNVHNKQEISRLNADYAEAFVIQDNFLVNPDTNFMIQPTRGFGDHDMHGTGYTHIPELTSVFSLPVGSLVVVASDGVFDDNVWSDREIVDRIGELYEVEGKTANEIGKIMYEETLERSEKSGYVDDISLVTFTAPALEKIKRKSTSHSRKIKSEKFQVKKSHVLDKKLSRKRINEPTSPKPKPGQDYKRVTLKRGEKKHLPLVIESILEAGEGASFEKIESSFQAIQKKKTLTLHEAKQSQLTVIKGEKSPSKRVLKQKKEVKAKVKKGGKTVFKKVDQKKKKNKKQKKKEKAKEKKKLKERKTEEMKKQKEQLKQKEKAKEKTKEKFKDLLDPNAQLDL